MKLLSLATFLTVLLLTFSGCINSIPTPSKIPIIDASLPVIKLTKTGIFKDMKAIGFEWKSIEDARVKGIYVYKKDFTQRNAKYVFIDTIQSRFVTHYIDEDVEPESKYGYFFKTYTLRSESKESKKSTVETLPIFESVSWIHVVENMPRSAKIIWRPHNNKIVKEYILERKTLQDTKWTRIDTISGRLSAEYIDSELKDKFIYLYRLKAYTYNNITSRPSKEVTVLTKSLPSSVQNIKATNAVAKKIRLSWKPSNIKAFSHYNIYRADNINDAYDLIAQAREANYVDKINEDGKYYFYRISVVDKDDLESISDKQSIGGKTLSKPKAPSAVKVQIINNSLKLDWESLDPRVKSFIVVKKVKISWIKTRSEAFEGVGGYSFIDKVIKPLTTYSYEVYSVDQFGIRSNPSIEVEYTTTKEEGIQVISEPKNIAIPKNEVKEVDTQNVIQAIENFDVSSQ